MKQFVVLSIFFLVFFVFPALAVDPKPDINGDGIVGIQDLVIQCQNYGKVVRPNEPADTLDENGKIYIFKRVDGTVIYLADLDFDFNKRIGYNDLVIVAKSFGMTERQVVAFIASAGLSEPSAVKGGKLATTQWAKIKVVR